ncbi:MAG: hypothetical protein ACREOJ_12985 [Gemmatimonadaceae bacterium]
MHPEERPLRVACGPTPRRVAIPNAAPGTQRAPGLSLSLRRDRGGETRELGESVVEDGLRLVDCRSW